MYYDLTSPLWHVHNMVSGAEFMIAIAVVAAGIYFVGEKLSRPRR